MQPVPAKSAEQLMTDEDRQPERDESTPVLSETPVVHSYTRQQAIDDGVLLDVSEMAREAGFKFPVALTCALWFEWVYSDEASQAAGQDEAGRLWDVLWMLFLAIKANESTTELHFQVAFLVDDNRHEEVTLKAVCGPGDDLAPCITIMLPNED